MRILICTENWLPKVDGVTRTLARLLEHLHATGHEVLLLGPESGMESYAGAEIIGTAGLPFFPYPELRLNLWRPHFTKKLLEFRPHVIHLVDPVWLGAAALAICRWYAIKAPIVASYHTNLATYCGHFGWGIFSPLMWQWNKFCHSKCAYTVCPSKSTSHILIQHGFRNVRIWPRGVDTSLFSPTQRSEQLRAHWLGTSETKSAHKSIILYVGRVSFEKNLGLVVDAYKTMDHHACHLVIVGHGPAFDELQLQCARNHIPVTFTGYLQGKSLAAAFASADVFAFPSVTETFGQVVLEAMASGLPVVGLDAEGVCDLVDHNSTGLLLNTSGLSSQEQCTHYKNHLMTLVRDTALCKTMAQRAVAKAKEYSWFEAMELLVNTYIDAVNNQPLDSASIPATSTQKSMDVDLLLYESGIEESGNIDIDHWNLAERGSHPHHFHV
ncbi:glycosyl transferase group 1 [Radiomyces spectabilis]|uniref:glycosyl transferase group 1 n=1 Tax=Radiomyces spectabilis TaxID=64574 RepID=UPI00221EE8F3|nr:glycosyl transferase group 1 [Radiomyces spectabilis]KAI8377740.1 glycosyl transferase group 1 [Radiomyces spectabilis]